MNPFSNKGMLIAIIGCLFQICFPNPPCAQAQPAAQPEEAQLRLRKSVKTREYQGRQVEGEERVVAPRDSLWKFLIQEKGLPEKEFGRYVMIIAALNPHIKNPGALPIGDIIFIPIRPNDMLDIKVPDGTEKESRVYRVKPGDYLYRILRSEAGTRSGSEMMSAVKQVMEMNPKKKNWEVLIVGETIVLPGKSRRDGLATTAAKQPSLDPAETDRGNKLPLQENILLLEHIMSALGNEFRRTGVEELTVQEGVIRIDRGSYPVIENPKIAQKVILDLNGRMPRALKTRVEKENAATRIVSAKRDVSLHEAVEGLLSQLGFQSLPRDRPVVIQDAAIGVIVKGDWIVASAEGSGNNEMIIINLVGPSAHTADYVKDYLSTKGLSLREIGRSQPGPSASNLSTVDPPGRRQIETWPSDKSQLLDAFLKLYDIPYDTDHKISLALREGISIELKIDRLFERSGKKTALFFRPMSEEVKKALETAEGVRSVEIDLQAGSSRDLISRLLDFVGEPAAYRRHRFPANEGRDREKVVVTIPGFFLPQRSLLLTDGEIPKGLERFFSDRGFRVVYFR